MLIKQQIERTIMRPIILYIHLSLICEPLIYQKCQDNVQNSVR